MQDDSGYIELLQRPQASVYAHAFYRAARDLATTCRAGSVLESLESYPILYLYRQSLMLYVQAILHVEERIRSYQESHVRDLKLEVECLVDLPKILEDAFESVGQPRRIAAGRIGSFQQMKRFLQSLRGIELESNALASYRDPRAFPHPLDGARLHERMSRLMTELDQAVTELETISG